jgi:PAS domain S-box-containing protein
VALMTVIPPASDVARLTRRRTEEIFQTLQQRIVVGTDRMFAVLMAVQWLFGIALAVWLSPRAWAGAQSAVHLHVWAAVVLGGVISVLPISLAIFYPGRFGTRMAIAIGQTLTSALLIHLTGGRIETHFHVFGSLAFLAFYRDWRVLVPATVVVAVDHFVRGLFWPESVYGVLTASSWRFLEHAGWVVFEDIVLVFSCVRGTRELWDIAERTAEHESSEDRYRAVVGHTADAIVVFDLEDHRILECNPAFLTLSGVTGDEAGRARIDAIVTPLAGESSIDYERLIVDGTEVERTLRRADGAMRAVACSVSSTMYARKRAICVVIRDITERKRVETGPGARPRRGRGVGAVEVPVPGQHEPRDPHAHEWRARHVGTAPRNRSGAESTRVRGDDSGQRRRAARDHQRHSGFLEGEAASSTSRSSISISARRSIRPRICWPSRRSRRGSSLRRSSSRTSRWRYAAIPAASVRS